MCGRFCLDADLDTVIKHFGLKQNVVLTPRYNIAPHQVVPVIRKPGQLEFLSWGLRPAWLSPEHSAFINARLETLTEKPAFKQAFQRRRCLIVANGYYEWRQIGNTKQPYFIRLSQRELFAFAGMWDGDSCTIITMPSQQAEIKAVHERMPLVLDPQTYEQWLNPTVNIEIIKNLIHNNITQQFLVSPVSTQVNSPKYDSATCIQPLQ